MSSCESEGRNPPVKKRRLANACDGCRSRKSDSQIRDGKCSNCLESRTRCTHEVIPKKRGTKNYSRQVTELQERVRQLETALKESRESQSIASKLNVSQEPPIETPSPQSSEEEDDLEYLEIIDALKKSSLTDNHPRYFGPSSNIYFLRKMMQGETPVNITGGIKWTMYPWETPVPSPKSDLIFPEDDLLTSLLDYYERDNPGCCPLFHWPSFRRDVESGLHFVNRDFGCTLLLVCALASRSSHDPRMLIDGASWHSAGWKYFSQVTPNVSPLTCPTIYDIQICILSAIFLLGSSAPQSGWLLVGLAMRYAVELGYHRHIPGPPSVENELKKRAFWCTYFIDRNVCLYGGRPVSLRDEDFDVELPLEVDDEYWVTGNPETDFQQPSSYPSRVSFFIHQIKLVQIVSFALRTVHGISKSKQAAGMGGDSPENMMSVLDSMLNEWFNNLPAHLRWDPTRTANPFFDPSAMLILGYYSYQITFHRTFIHRGTSQSLPSLAICTHAARSMSRVLESFMMRHPLIPTFIVSMLCFTAGMISVLNIRTRQKTSTDKSSPPSGKDVDDLMRILAVMRAAEIRFNVTSPLIRTLLVLSGVKCDFLSPHCPGDIIPDHGIHHMNAHSGYTTSGGAQDISDIDPSLFGLRPKEEPIEPTLEWNAVAQAHVDMSLFEDDAVTMWADKGAMNYVPVEHMNEWNEYTQFPNEGFL